MKNKLKNKTIAYLLSMACVMSFAACGDWTETESLEIAYPKVEEHNPELYSQYINKLKAYKQSEHKVTYAWFDNSQKIPYSRGQHIINVPDSVDYLILMYPDNLVSREVDEMQKVREGKAIKVLCPIDYDAIKLAHDLKVIELLQGGAAPENIPDFMNVLTHEVESTLAMVSKYNYDGIVVGYKGKSSIHMTDDEKAAFTAYQNAYIGKIMTWYDSNKNKMISFMGKPQNILDKTILNSFSHFILPTIGIVAPDQLTVEAKTALEEGVPTDRFVVVATTASLDNTDVKTGYWADKTLAILSTASWVLTSHDGFGVAGMGIYNINNDYYNPQKIYPNSRKVIETMNPSIKN